MKKIFLKTLDLANMFGEITEATMYENSKFSTIHVETENGTYKISISKQEKEQGNEA